MIDKTPRDERGMLIAITGIDGAGKSTLAHELCGYLTEHGHNIVRVGKHTVSVPANHDLTQYLDAVNAVVYRRKPEVGAMCGVHYWLLALASWYTLLDTLVITPALRAGVHVIVDNTHHKIVARYATKPDVSPDLARLAFAHLTTPDAVLHLRVTPDEALRRKGQFTALEAGYSGESAEHFIAYQRQVTEQLANHGDQDGWAVIDANDSGPDQVLRDALTILAEHGIGPLDLDTATQAATSRAKANA